MATALSRVVDALPALVWTARPDGHIDFVSDGWCDFTGLSVADARRHGWQAATHPDDLAELRERWRSILASGEPGVMEARLRRSDGEYRWFLISATPLADESGRAVRWCGVSIDIEHRKRAEDDVRMSDRRFRLIVDGLPTLVSGSTSADDVDDRIRAEALLAAEKRFLEMVASGHSMPGILDALCHLVESTASGCYCSVVLVDERGACLEHGAAPSLPESFISSIVGRPVNVESGPCAMASYLNEQVIAADLTSETRWAEYAWCPMALAHGLQACWSTPITSTAGKVLGAFALYYTEPAAPTPQHQALIDHFTHIASIAIERAVNDAALERSEARKAAILDSALDCIVTIDHEGRITEFNPAAERTFGYRRDEVVGEQLADILIPPSLGEHHRRGLARYLATGDGHILGKRVEMTALRADGSEFPAELAITRIPVDGPPSFTGYLRDITERKRSEEDLRRSEAFLAEAQYVSATGSFSWRVAADEITWSEQVYRMFELDPAVPVTLERIGARVHPDDLPLLHDMIGRARGDGSDFEYEHRLLMPDHSIKYLHMVAHGTRDQYGQLEYIGAVQDVTERRRSEEALGRLRSELARVARVTSLGALTASIAHEVNQPLAGIITNASTCLRMLAAEPPNVEGARETARRTLRDGNRASEVITRLRALFSRRDPRNESVDLNDAVREVITLSMGDLQRSGVMLRPELADDLPPVMGDRVQLQQVILNLLLNASEAMSEVDDRPRQLVIGTAVDERDQVRLSVQDAGTGIAAESADTLFDAFYTTKRGGMGIGLSVSRSIIESHAGHISAVPNDGPGATFSFWLPAAEAHITKPA